MISRCKCEHDYQDHKYGKGFRIWNPTLKGRRCTVCDTTVSDDTAKEVSKKKAKKQG